MIKKLKLIVLFFVLLELIFTYLFKQPTLFNLEYHSDGYFFNPSNVNDYFSIGLVKSKILLNPNVSTDKKQYFFYNPIIFPMKTDSHGFRSDTEISLEKEKYRVMAVGDSITLGFSLPNDKTYSKLLSKQGDLEVINAGTIVNNSERSFNYFTKKGRSFNPDLLVLQVTVGGTRFTCDYIELDQYDFNFISKVIMYIKNLDSIFWRKEIKQQNYSEITNVNLAMIDEKDINRWLNRNNNVLYKHWYTWRFLANTFFQQYLGVETFLAPYFFSLPVFNAKKTLNNILKIKAFVDSDKKKFLVLIVPNRVGCYGATRTNWDKLVTDLKINQIDFLDFRKDFCQKFNAEPIEALYIPNDFHPNTEANRIISNEILNFIKTSGAISEK